MFWLKISIHVKLAGCPNKSHKKQKHLTILPPSPLEKKEQEKNFYH